MTRKLAAEAFGTFWLVFAGCGSAIFAGHYIGYLGIALAFGLTVLTMAATVGSVSGGHFNPAVTVGLVVAGRHPAAELGPYAIAQVIGALLAAAILAFLVKDLGGDLGQFAANGFGADGMPGEKAQLGVAGAFITEALMTFVFLSVIIGSTSKGAAPGLPPIAIGLCLALIHLVTIPLTNTSVNPARSTSQALFAGGPWIKQLWLFWVAPITGGALAGVFSKWLQRRDDDRG
jgi:aquaporin Z